MEVGTENLAMTPDVMSSDKAAILEEFERRKKVKAINVSTSDSEVEEDRRKLREPICLFGEGPADRRSRLRELLGRLGEDDVKRRRIMDDMRADEDNEVRSEDTTWYHEGPDSLRVAREWIAQYSIPRDKERLKHLKAESELPTARMELDNSVPCLASCSSDGSVKLWSLDSEEPMADIESHDVRVSWCVYRPSGRFLATAAHTNLVSNVKFEKSSEFTGMLVNTIKMWSSQETLGGQRDNTLLAGHISQAARVLGITVNLDQNHEMTEEFIEEKNFLVSLNANHIEAYAIKSEPFQRTNL